MAKQQGIPFEEADAAFAERRNELATALHLVECDCQLSVLMQWVFNTEAKTGQPLQKTYRELAQRPYGMCCSLAKARATVSVARHKGLLCVDEQRYRSGGQEANQYTIDWAGVSAILRGRRTARQGNPSPRARADGSDLPTEDSCGQESSRTPSVADGSVTASHPPRPGALIKHPSAFIEQGGVLREHPPASTEQPYKGNTLFEPSLDPSLAKEFRSGPEAGPKSKGGDRTRGELLREVPELAAAACREVVPLDPGATRFGAIGALADKHLRSPLALVEWFRRQLGSPRPIGEPTEADFLLVFTAMLYAAAVDAKQVRVGRLAIAGAILGHGRWRKSLPKLPTAIQRLETLKAVYGGELFTIATWPPAKITPDEDQDDPHAAGEEKSKISTMEMFRRVQAGLPALP